MVASRETLLSLTDKKVWKKRPRRLAKIFDYKYNRRFRRALGRYYEEVVKPASCTTYLGVFAVGFLEAYRPRLNHKNH
ncbi:hypothetical protein COT62_00870 [Candidatus Roizmanbacteria bacterium CG09_land_8_20_14_0_10_41_9]|uniref:Uncharacterized protein n=1 Tax=Candidatus Roizmanbacteria bacterium CG09_land_8_20_14_0_10_41_9 TaxID=1974850 RepID=A0A2H0WVM9_9BACT|nr:MAG: hypothetical protein COT62_00870 [Candidatus Roizmanbacteria bacterium CG09_land_8_20_14_0_10_41_9]